MLRKTCRLLPFVLLCSIGQIDVSMADGPPFIAHVPNGTVELVGITDYPPAKHPRWWQPNGSPAQVGSFRPDTIYRTLPIPNLADAKRLTFLVHFRSPSEDVSPEDAFAPRPAGASAKLAEERSSDGWWPVWTINPSGPSWKVDYVARVRTGTASQQQNIFSPWWAMSRVVDHNGNVVPNWRMFHVTVSASAEEADFGVGIDTGMWETMITQKPDLAGARTFSRNGKRWTITFQRARAGETANTTQVRYKTPLLLYDFYNIMAKRLVAVAQDGTVVESKYWGYWGLNQTGSSVDLHKLPLSSIKEYRFQVCSYQWAEFKNVSLHPGLKTAVQAVSPDKAENTKK